MAFDIYFFIEDDNFYYSPNSRVTLKKITFNEICNSDKSREKSIRKFTKRLYSELFPKFSLKKIKRLKTKIFINKGLPSLYKEGVFSLFAEMKVFMNISLYDRDFEDRFSIEDEIKNHVDEN